LRAISLPGCGSWHLRRFLEGAANWANDRPNFTSLEVARAQYEKVAEDMRLKHEAAPRDVIRDQAKRIVEKRV
jgi:hypothetical protein